MQRLSCSYKWRIGLPPVTTPYRTRRRSSLRYFIVTITHPDGQGWGEHVIAHAAFLKRLIDAGHILVSGLVNSLEKRAGFIIMTVSSFTFAPGTSRFASISTASLTRNLIYDNRGHLSTVTIGLAVTAPPLMTAIAACLAMPAPARIP